MKAYPYLFQNARIGNMNVPNRVIMAPLTRTYAAALGVYRLGNLGPRALLGIAV